jgi:hypothetical protein
MALVNVVNMVSCTFCAFFIDVYLGETLDEDKIQKGNIWRAPLLICWIGGCIIRENAR